MRVSCARVAAYTWSPSTKMRLGERAHATKDAVCAYVHADMTQACACERRMAYRALLLLIVFERDALFQHFLEELVR